MADPRCNQTFPVCSGDYDAIFVATNDPTWVRNTANQAQLPPLFLIGDFPSLEDYLLPETSKLPSPEESAEMLLIEEMIMVLSDMFVPSFPSSVTMQVLRMRIDAYENRQEEWAKHLLDTYYDFHERALQKLQATSPRHKEPGQPKQAKFTRQASSPQMMSRPFKTKMMNRPPAGYTARNSQRHQHQDRR
jgi:hypothetical protein